jgi:hypothetical protein
VWIARSDSVVMTRERSCAISASAPTRATSSAERHALQRAQALTPRTIVQTFGVSTANGQQDRPHADESRAEANHFPLCAV